MPAVRAAVTAEGIIIVQILAAYRRSSSISTLLRALIRLDLGRKKGLTASARNN